MARGDVVRHRTLLSSTTDPSASHGVVDVDNYDKYQGRRERIAQLERELRALRQAERDDDDGAWLRQLAAAVDVACCFSVTDLLAHAQIDPALAAALDGMSPKRIGKRLDRLQDRDLDGVRLERLKKTNTGCLWVIQQSPSGLS